MDSLIKQYADSLYGRALAQSAATARQGSAEFRRKRASAPNSALHLSGVEIQAHAEIYAAHIDRCVEARLESYQTAFSEVNRLPTEDELREILSDFKATWELQINHSNRALIRFLASRSPGKEIDLSEALRASSAHGHDRVLQEWKIWLGKVQLRNSGLKTESRQSNTLPASIATTQAVQEGSEPVVGAVSRPELGESRAMNSAFISYSWDDEAHREWVRELAKRLRTDGVDVSLDRWETVPGDDLPLFMERAIRENQFVVIVCTPRYKRRSDLREGGVGYEGDIMTGEVLTSQNKRKFIPVLRRGAWKDASPSWLSGKYYINLSGEKYSERNYEDLVRTLLGVRETAPPIGKPMSTITPSADQRDVSKGFEDIKITRVVVEEITEPPNDGTPGSALYSIPFALSASPPSEWGDLFIENWNHPPQWTTMHRPGIASVYGSTIILDGTTIEEVERYHRDTLQGAVAKTNAQYREWRQREEQRLAREEEARDARRKRIEGASKRIKFD